jgi:flagellar basal body-associated protein FliL
MLNWLITNLKYGDCLVFPWGKNMRGKLLKKEIIFGIVILLTSSGFIPVFLGSNTQQAKEQRIRAIPVPTLEKTTTITFYVFEKTKFDKHNVVISMQDATQIYKMFQELKKELAAHPVNEQTRQLEQQFLSLLREKNAIPTGITQQDLAALLQPPLTPAHAIPKDILPLPGNTAAWFCNFATTGEGSAFPIIILPRFIPFILTPIPRIFVYWSTQDGLTSVGGLISHKGFMAGGMQKGIALGFWGIGFSIFLPPVDLYGIFGYALFTRVNAQYVEYWPPNNPPEITQTDPANGQTMVGLSTKELRFSISDVDGDLMSYNVTTNPDIGSGSGGLKPDGVYSIPISGLDGFTNYTWHISVTDGKDTTEETLGFTTEPVGPVITKPIPENGDRDVPMNLPQLQFSIKDYQSLAMEYTVQTSPNIGSDHKVGVHDGTFSVPVSGMTYGAEYRWFINTTDGTYWARKVYSFKTGYPSPFDPFEYGWHYRKQITINHTKVAGDLQNFPVLLKITDADLMKAQIDAGDILFMNGPGEAAKLHHEIELFDASSGTIVSWVNISTLSSNENTILYMYYGNPNCVNQEYSEKTWNSNFLLVYHMKDSTLLTINDSTINHNTCGKYGSSLPIESPGKIGKAQYFNGNIGCYMNSSDDISHGSNPWTYECWYKADSYGSSENPYPTDPYSIFFSVSPHSQTHYLVIDIALRDSENRFGCHMDNQEADGCSYTDNLNVFDNQWHYAVVVRDNEASQFKMYIDGSPDYVVVSSISPGYTIQTAPLDIGALYSYYPNRMYYEGYLDEIHISNTDRSPQWISTSFNNQNNPMDFLFIGPEESHP